MDQPRIRAFKGDITQCHVDAIVNAANSSLCGGGGVDGAIHRAAGPELLALARTLGGCPAGDARLTPGFNLPAKFIIHAVGPVWWGGSRGEDALLESAYRASLSLAAEHGLETVAFPAISTGAYKFPRERATRIAVATVRRFLETHPAMAVEFVCFDDATVRLYHDALAAP
jgi:O-acetyl-ADP-ribose deacetylase (regulator of RNase III)